MLNLMDLLSGATGGGTNMPPAQNPIPSAPPPMSPQAAPMPSAAPLPGPQRPSLLDRIGHALSMAEGGLSNRIRPNAPAGYSDELSALGVDPSQASAEMASARPGLLRSIFYGPNQESPDQLYAKNLDAVVGRHVNAMGMANQSRVLASRQAFAANNPLPDANDEKAYGAYVNKALGYSLAHGDDERVKLLQPIADQFAKNLHNRPFEPQLFKGPNGEMQYFSPDEQTMIPPGWQQVFKPGATGMGTPQLFRGMKNGKVDYVGVSPGDNDTLAKLSAAGYKPEVTARTEFVQNETQGRFDTTQQRNGVNDFTKQISKLTPKAQALNEAEMVLTNAQKSGNPTYYGPAISRFVQAVEQSQNLRYQLLQYYSKNLDPSFKGSWEQLRDRLTKGVITPRIMAGMLSQVRDMRDLTKQEIESQRKQFVDRSPEMDAVLPRTDSYFMFGGAQPGASSGAASGNAAGRTVTVNGKKFVLPQ